MDVGFDGNSRLFAESSQLSQPQDSPGGRMLFRFFNKLLLLDKRESYRPLNHQFNVCYGLSIALKRRVYIANFHLLR